MWWTLLGTAWACQSPSPYKPGLVDLSRSRTGCGATLSGVSTLNVKRNNVPTRVDDDGYCQDMAVIMQEFLPGDYSVTITWRGSGGSGQSCSHFQLFRMVGNKPSGVLSSKVSGSNPSMHSSEASFSSESCFRFAVAHTCWGFGTLEVSKIELTRCDALDTSDTAACEILGGRCESWCEEECASMSTEGCCKMIQCAGCGKCTNGGEPLGSITWEPLAMDDGHGSNAEDSSLKGNFATYELLAVVFFVSF